MEDHEVLTPIIVTKKGERYETSSIGPTLSQRDLLLMLVLKEVGGVNINNPDGDYFFNAVLSLNDEKELEYDISFESIDNPN